MAKSNTVLIVAALIAVGIIVLSSNVSASDNSSTDSSGGSGGSAADMVSQNQLSLTAQLEGFEPKAYRDGGTSSNPLYSIGYGHQIQPGEQYLMTATINQGQGQQFLLNDMQNVVDTINNSGVQFTQGQFDAASDYGYNAGVGALGNLINLFNAQGADAVAAWLPTSRITSSGVTLQNLINRRNQEVQTWNS